MTKLQKSLKKIFKISAFLGIRECYLLPRNLYGIAEHPFLTMGRIYKQKDLSQGILIFGLPGYFWLLTIFFLAILRFLLGIRGNLGWIAQISLVLITSIAALLFTYLLYFLFETFKKINKGK